MLFQMDSNQLWAWLAKGIASAAPTAHRNRCDATYKTRPYMLGKQVQPRAICYDLVPGTKARGTFDIVGGSDIHTIWFAGLNHRMSLAGETLASKHTGVRAGKLRTDLIVERMDHPMNRQTRNASQQTPGKSPASSPPMVGVQQTASAVKWILGRTGQCRLKNCRSILEADK